MEHVVENGVDVFLSTLTPFCVDRGEGSLCWMSSEECFRAQRLYESNGKRLDRGCYGQHAVACFMMTTVLSGEREVNCVKSMELCQDVQMHYATNADFSGVTKCFVARER